MFFVEEGARGRRCSILPPLPNPLLHKKHGGEGASKFVEAQLA
jgi:hypothetical protein